MRTADRGGPRLIRAQIQSERRQEMDRTENSFCFFYIAFVLFVCFFPDSPTQPRVPRRVQQAILLLELSPAAAVTELRGLSLCCSWPRPGFRRGCGCQGRSQSRQQGARRRRCASCLPGSFFFPSEPFSGCRAHKWGGWTGRQEGPGPRKMGRRWAERWATSHELGLLHSFLVRRGVPGRVAGDVGARAAA